jgi:hypothetical protein
VALAGAEPAASGAALLALGVRTGDADAALAGAARAAVLDLARGTLPPPAEGEEWGSQAEAYAAWWRGPTATEAKITALARFASVKDPVPEDVLLPYLEDVDPHVASAAWRTLREVAGPLGEDPRTAAPRRAWWAALPPFEDGALLGPSAPEARQRLAAWARARPPS